MKLPHAERAVVDIEKLRDYSLNPEHEKGKHKTRVFRAAMGFTPKDAERLREMVLAAIVTNEAQVNSPNAYGQRLAVDFEADGVRGKVMIRSTWIIRDNEDFPRLTSCYVL